MRVIEKLLAILLVCIPASSMAAQTQVASEISLSGIKIAATTTVNADANVLWATLTDYNNLASFVPGMTLSRLVPSTKPGVKLVELKGEGGLVALILPDHFFLAMEERPYDYIGFRSVSGSGGMMQGEWVITGSRSPVQLSYRATVVPLFPPPPMVSDGYVQNEIRLRLDAVSREAEKRMRSPPK